MKSALENWPLTRLLEICSEHILSDDSAGFLRAKAAMPNGHSLEVAEYVVLEEEQLAVVSYKYHW